jgi:hypothetical protein
MRCYSKPGQKKAPRGATMTSLKAGERHV